MFTSKVIQQSANQPGDTLMECPFCCCRESEVSAPDALKGEEAFCVTCPNCHATGPAMESEEGARHEWNLRASVEEIPDEEASAGSN